MKNYFNDVTATATWTAISATSLMFIGTLTTLKANTASILIRGKNLNTVNGSVDGSNNEFIPFYQATDLSDIEIKCDTANQVLKVYGNVLPATSPLANVN